MKCNKKILMLLGQNQNFQMSLSSGITSLYEFLPVIGRALEQN